MIRRGRSGGRRLATVLFTDMVGSTERAIELGDRAWRTLLRRHHRAVRAELRRFGGHEVDSAGDGFFATFSQPAQAVRCALAIRAAVRSLGLAMRSAVHTGEVEPIGAKVGGVAVHLAARVLGAAGPDEVLVTSTVRELVAGSELTFTDAGTHTFKGFADSWHVFRVTGPEPSSDVLGADEPADRRLPARRSTLAIGGLIGAAGVVGVLLVIGLGGAEPGVTPGPNTVVRIDLDNRVVAAVPVARAPVALAAEDRGLWVASEAGTITRLDLDDFATQVVGSVGIPTALAVADGSVWVIQSYQGRVARIDALSVELRDTLEIHGRRVAAGDEVAWVTDDLGDRVLRLSAVTGTQDGAVALDAASGPRGIAIGERSVWVVTERSGAIVEIDQASLATVGHAIALGLPARDLAVGAGAVWVTSMDADKLIRIDPERGQVTDTIDMCNEPDAVVASGDGVWVACRADGIVRRMAPDGSLVADIAVPGVPSALAIVDDGVWVALRGD
ncbi:MAG TPA: adenylate/guanylate cyclase domain-containing protein [Candidatus Limnocylindria bacterium]